MSSLLFLPLLTRLIDDDSGGSGVSSDYADYDYHLFHQSLPFQWHLSREEETLV